MGNVSFNNFLKKLNISQKVKIKGYYIANWKKELYFKSNVFFVGDSASLVLPFTYEGIYYAMKSGKLAATAAAKNNPNYYIDNWRKLYYDKYKFLKLLQKIFLFNNYFINHMVRLYKKPYFQKAVIKYWLGKKKPLSTYNTIKKVISLIIKKYISF